MNLCKSYSFKTAGTLTRWREELSLVWTHCNPTYLTPVHLPGTPSCDMIPLLTFWWCPFHVWLLVIIHKSAWPLQHKHHKNRVTVSPGSTNNNMHLWHSIKPHYRSHIIRSFTTTWWDTRPRSLNTLRRSSRYLRAAMYYYILQAE
jgi:hypothetical protein